MAINLLVLDLCEKAHTGAAFLSEIVGGSLLTEQIAIARRGSKKAVSSKSETALKAFSTISSMNLSGPENARNSLTGV